MKPPHQQFKFEPMTAKYFKVKLLSSYGYGFNPTNCYEFALFGKLGGSPAAAATPAPAGQINLLAQSNGGEVLIAPLTAPSWAPIFGKIVAVTAKLTTSESPAEFEERMWRHCRGRLERFKIPQRVRITREEMHGGRFKKLRRAQGAGQMAASSSAQ